MAQLTSVDSPGRTLGSSTWKLLLIGLLFHLVYIGSVFDCYFTSPVVHGMQRHGLAGGPAKRLVLIVGDGLRADLLFNRNAFPSIPDSPEFVAPYLQSIAEKRGAFGVSHTHVPTESRPGHVALIAGMYEDVSAVTKGWKTNPVDFDSVFNQSSYTFSYGSPDILPMFARGAIPGRVKTWCYDAEDEDFTKDGTALDYWVLDNLRRTFANASSDPTLNAELRANKVVIFLHLLGLDTTGHSYRPHSKEYMKNIQVVDSVVRMSEQFIKNFYQDDETAFVFTADHGMSNIGNHGDGDPDNTRTPLIAWGKGVRGPLPDSKPSSHDEYSAQWGLTALYRRDVEQADIAPLMASLIGIEWPANSVGVLPDVDPTRPGYLDVDEKARAEAAVVNTKVILEHYRVKEEIKQAHTLFYKPFSSLADAKGISTAPAQLSELEAAFAKKRWTETLEKSSALIRTGLDALRYLQTYDRFVIRAIVTVGYLGWAAYGAVSIFDLQYSDPSSLTTATNSALTIGATALLAVFYALFALERAPWTYYLYTAFPSYFWHTVLQRLADPGSGVRAMISGFGTSVTLRTVIGSAILVVGALQGMVFAYTNRALWSVGFGLIGLVWPLASWSSELRSKRWRLLLAWMASCAFSAVFPLLSVEKQESIPTIMAGGLAMLVLGNAAAKRIVDGEEVRNLLLPSLQLIAMVGATIVGINLSQGGLVLLLIGALAAEGIVLGENKSGLTLVFGIQLVLVVITMGVTTSSTTLLQAKEGLPLLNQVLGWIVLGSAVGFPIVFRIKHGQPHSKLLMLFLMFAPCFTILSISVEGLFYLAYSITLVLWVEMEAALRGDAEVLRGERTRQLGADDIRIATFFLFFIQVAFFGTGNVASISSFYLEPVYRLVPIFNPFLMAALLVFKIVAPYVVLSAAFATLNARLSLPPFSLFLVALTLTDGMTMTFFFNVTDTGSWLEIGQTISFFCITSLLLVWSAGICAAGEWMMSDTLLVPASAPPEDSNESGSGVTPKMKTKKGKKKNI